MDKGIQREGMEMTQVQESSWKNAPYYKGRKEETQKVAYKKSTTITLQLWSLDTGNDTAFNQTQI